MSDLIERQAAIDALSYCQTYLFDSRDKDKKISLEDAEYAIEQLPSAQPEQKTGHWEDVPHKSAEHGEVVVDGETVRCSVCRHAEKGWNKGMNYCPECGAKMEVEHEA